MLVWAKKFYGDDFVVYLQENYEPVDVVFRLAQETSLVLLNGGGFDAPEWSIRCSLANLKREDYVRIGEGIASILHSYADKWIVEGINKAFEQNGLPLRSIIERIGTRSHRYPLSADRNY